MKKKGNFSKALEKKVRDYLEKKHDIKPNSKEASSNSNKPQADK
jgi:hypothetical protein